MKKVLLGLCFVGLVGCGPSDNEKRQEVLINIQKEQIKDLEGALAKKKATNHQDKEEIKNSESDVAASEAAMAMKFSDAGQSSGQARLSANKISDEQKYLTARLVEKMGSPEMALCTAAALKAGHGSEIYSMWFDALTERYTKTYPSKTADEIERYVDERVMDKKHNLESKGIDSPQAFYNYYQLNCES